jgi:putative acetyltransferase
MVARQWKPVVSRLERQRSSSLEIRRDDLRGPEVAALLREHLESVAEHSPPGSIHALDLDGLRAPSVTFWSVWAGSVLVGCGAIKEIDGRHGEVKSMRTASPHLRRGVATAMLEHILKVARQRGYRRISLETGSQDAFAPARALYARFGFVPCGPFADYVDDPNSVYMTLRLDA